MKPCGSIPAKVAFIALFLIMGGQIFAQAPIANFSANKVAGCSPLVVSFQDASAGATSWSWDFGNGSTSNIKNPSTTYFTPGTYTVKLTASNASGSNTVTKTNYITVFEKPAVNFKASDSFGCAPLGIQLTNLTNPGAGNTISTVTWDMGNGTTSSAANPFYTYNISGNFSVTLIVTNDKGCIGSLNKSKYIKVLPPVVAGFNFSTPNVCRPPFGINFTNTTTGSGTFTYQWNFGDGTSSAQPNPQHNYTAAGTYSVSLVAVSSDGCLDTVTKTVDIPSRITSFSSADTICTGQQLKFTNTSVPNPTSSNWIFGDGGNSSALSPTKIYNTAGIYLAKLISTYSNCIDSAKKTILVLPKATPDFTGGPKQICKVPAVVNFQDQSGPAAVSWLWDFGDGTTSTQQSPSHSYNSYGVYDVKLTVTNANGCADSIKKTAFIKVQQPTIAMGSFTRRGCIPFTLKPSANVSTFDNVTGYLWNFGDGTTSTLAKPTHVYNTQGKYTLSLTITTATGCSSTVSLVDSIWAGTHPVIDFNATPIPVCAKSPVTFTNLTAPADQYQWKFGDGGRSTKQDPVYEYILPGTFDVTLYAWNYGCLDSLTKPMYMTVFPPVARYRATPDCNNRLKYTFTDQSIQPLTWDWDFGDGTTSTQQHPVHFFPALGSYNVRLIVTNGSCQDTITKTIRTIDENPDFTAVTPFACKNANATLKVTNTDISLIKNFTWTFGDGSFTLPTIRDSIVNHAYNATGLYSIKLVTVDLNNCKDSIIKNSFLSINGPKAGFSAPVVSGCAGTTFNFTDASTTDGRNPIGTRTWLWGDKQTDIINTSPYQHRYDSVGVFSVSLIATDTTGCSDTLTIPNYITTSKPNIAFSVDDSAACPGSKVTFINNSTGNSLQYTWLFGDGGTSTVPNPVYNYNTTGKYSVTLKVKDQYNCVDSFTKVQYINVDKPVSAFFMSDSVSLCPPFKVDFVNQSSLYSSVKWDFGDGSTTTLNDPSHYYTQVNKYTVALIAIHPKGCTDTSKQTIRILDSTNIKIGYTPLIGCKPMGVDFTASGATSQAFDYLWDFGNGITDTSSGSKAHNVYNLYGNFVPRLIVKDHSGCVSAIEGADTIKVRGAKSNFGADNNFFCISGTVNFIDSTTSNDKIINYTWNFGDGKSSNAQQPSHFYQQPGNYTVTLSTITQAGCKDTITKPQLIKLVDKPHISITGDSIICIHDTLRHIGNLLIADTAAINWKWDFPNGNTASVQLPPVQQYDNAGKFKVRLVATKTPACADTAYKNIIVNGLPTSSLPDVLEKIAGYPVDIKGSYGSGVNKWTWDNTPDLNCSNCPFPSFDPKTNKTFTVDFADVNGCVNKDSVYIKILCPGSALFVPNTFSPNGDGSNDVFYPRGKGIVNVKLLRVYNRWGELVFEKQNFQVNDAASGWNGIYKGKKAPADVYIFQCQAYCENNELITLNGNVALIQ